MPNKDRYVGHFKLKGDRDKAIAALDKNGFKATKLGDGRLNITRK